MDFERPVRFNSEATQIWANYYTKKSKHGAGIPGYRGEIYQRGEGLWDSIVRIGLPIIKYLGPKVANTVVTATGDAIRGENFLSSLKKAGKSEIEGVVEDVVSKAKSKLIGRGRRRRRLKSRSKISGQGRRRMKGRGKKKKRSKTRKGFGKRRKINTANIFQGIPSKLLQKY